MAIVSTAVAWFLLRATSRSSSRVAAAFLLATTAAAGVAVLAGARAPFGIMAVAIVIAAFATAGQLLVRPSDARR